ncbi:MAG: ABC transporter permease, partial [Actinomycetes bacterium]
MNVTFALATARRILTQLRHDRRTVAMMILVPSLLMVLLRYVFNTEQAFSAAAPALLAVFPFAIMFIVTSITTLRERTTETLERLMTLPIAKLDLLFGYAIAFGVVAVLQVLVATGISLSWLGLSIDGSVWLLIVIAVLDALLGTALGLLASAFARTEFQA